MKIYGFDSKCNICGENIRQIRAKKKVTQTDLAARLQVRGVQINQNSICRIERGKRVVADYIACMTDTYAISVFEKLFVPKEWSSL